MENLQTLIDRYLEFCRLQKRLDAKTLKAYGIDLKQFRLRTGAEALEEITTETLEEFIASLHLAYRPRTAKRKIAALKAFCRYLEFRDILNENPFRKIQIRFREPVILPKTIPLYIVETFLSVMYGQKNSAATTRQKQNALRDIAVVELLFASGMRISELCQLKPPAVNLHEGTVLIYGKGSKERRIQIGNEAAVNILREYQEEFRQEILLCGYFFVNCRHKPLSDQAVRRMLNKYTTLAAIDLHITPHMFRHTFATSLLEADVDIRYIQEMLGHSSIHVTELYTHVALSKQRDILAARHPRKDFHIGCSNPSA